MPGMQHAEASKPVTSNWRDYGISEDGSHHVYDGQSAYTARFLDVLKFHAPGLETRTGTPSWEEGFGQ